MKKQEKQNFSNQGSKKPQNNDLGSNHVINEQEEKTKAKKTGKIAIEEVDFSAPNESSATDEAVPAQRSAEVASSQEHVYQKSDSPTYGNFQSITTAYKNIIERLID